MASPDFSSPSDDTDTVANAASPELLQIAAAEEATGVTRELLRMWERRYEFPKPLRNEAGDRVYSPEQIEKLRLIRQLLSLGFRPGYLVRMSVPELQHILHAHAPKVDDFTDALREELMAALKSRDIGKIHHHLSHQLTKHGLYEFVVNFLPYANFIVGDEWQKGNVEIHEEHLYTEQVQGLLRITMDSLLPPREDSPRVMLCTAPGEPHTLGIFMVEALLRLERVNATSFGPQIPEKDIAQAAVKHKMDIVALSFSASYPINKAADFLESLRFRMPVKVDIWAGGGAIRGTRRHVEGVKLVPDLETIRNLIQNWQAGADRKLKLVRH